MSFATTTESDDMCRTVTSKWHQKWHLHRHGERELTARFHLGAPSNGAPFSRVLGG